MGLSENKHTRKGIKMPEGLDLLLAFISGVVLTLLFVGLINLANGNGPIIEGLEIVALLAPLCIGIIVPLIGKKRNPVLISAGLGRSLLVLAGIALCGLPLASSADAATDAAEKAYCNTPGIHCHMGSIATPVTFLYVIYGALLIIPSALLTGLILKLIKGQAKRENRKEEKGATGPPSVSSPL